MIRVGIVGFGFMGRTHMSAWQKAGGAEVVAVCDKSFADGKPLAEVAGNMDTTDDGPDLSAIETYSDYDAMLRDAGLDVVSIALPTFLHCEATVKALEAGMHVLCEKPMALTLDECDAMVAAADRTGKQLQIGHCIRFWPEYMKLKELVDSGNYGKVLFANFTRLGSKPGWAADSWFADDSRSGGMIVDLHIHDTDYVLHLFGKPKSLSSMASNVEGVQDHVQTQYNYDNGACITAEGSWAVSPSFGFRMAFMIGMEKATVEFNTSLEGGMTIHPFEGESITPELVEGSGYENQVAHFAKQIQGESTPDILTPAQSRETIEVVLAEKKSATTGKSVTL